MMQRQPQMTRRTAVLGLVSIALAPPASATPQDVAASITELFGDRTIADGPITLSLPPLAESGNSVPLSVAVEGSASGPGRIVRLAVFAERNPRPMICAVSFGPKSAEAKLSTNIRLASTQAVVCVAERADSSLIQARREVRVVVGACTALDGRY
jgi:sulfur-oxidizing protein SoxY